MVTLRKLLEQVKEINVQRSNVMSREELQKTIQNNIIKYKEIIFEVCTPIWTESFNELWKQEVINEVVYRKLLFEDTVR